MSVAHNEITRQKEKNFVTSRPTTEHILLLKFSMDLFSYLRWTFLTHHWIFGGPIFRGLIFLVDVFTVAVFTEYHLSVTDRRTDRRLAVAIAYRAPRSIGR